MEGKGTRRVGPRASLENGSLKGEELPIEQLRRLVRLLDSSDVTELEVKSSATGLRLALRKGRAAGGGLAATPGQAPSEAAEEPTALPGETRHTIVSPWVGIFHTWGKPKGGPLVQVGDLVRVGQLVATVESLNVINEVESPVAGRISEILVQEGQAVEYGQPLMVVDSVQEA
jgi:acetyl-CoA carboxylase biotin carboxyl carrier protein